jgi:hypothetical protein
MNNFNSINTAVLFITYKRLDTTIQVFESIRKAKPPRIYISSNIGKDEAECKKVQIVRDYINYNIDWECEVKKLFRTKHLSAKLSISGAIDWFFEHEEMGIILEDDCLPSQSFFWYCEELLAKYKEDMRVWHISGDNFQNGIIRGDSSYYFSAFNHVWGWAGWADRWKFYDVDSNQIQNESFLRTYWQGREFKYWRNIFWKIKNNEIDTWDYQWSFTMWINGGLAILPKINLVSNIGFGEDATHTKGTNINTTHNKFNELTITKHPIQIVRNIEADKYTFKHHSAPSILIRIITKLKEIINEM